MIYMHIKKLNVPIFGRLQKLFSEQGGGVGSESCGYCLNINCTLPYRSWICSCVRKDHIFFFLTGRTTKRVKTPWLRPGHTFSLFQINTQWATLKMLFMLLVINQCQVLDNLSKFNKKNWFAFLFIRPISKL